MLMATSAAGAKNKRHTQRSTVAPLWEGLFSHLNAFKTSSETLSLSTGLQTSSCRIYRINSKYSRTWGHVGKILWHWQARRLHKTTSIDVKVVGHASRTISLVLFIQNIENVSPENETCRLGWLSAKSPTYTFRLTLWPRYFLSAPDKK